MFQGYVLRPRHFLLFEKTCHESWNFPAGVSFALKQNMYWGGFCAFLPDISGLGGGGGVFPVFSLLGNPLIDMDLRNACTCIESTLLYSCTFPQTCVF